MTSSVDRQVRVNYLQLIDADEQAYSCLYGRLTPIEQTHARQYSLAPDRVAFAAGRALVRTMLSKIAPVPPGGWQIVPGLNGKPQLQPGSGFEFSISHTSKMVAAAVAVGRAVGVDVESTLAEVSIEEIARDRFDASECALIAPLDEDSRREAFFSLWALHEAYAKAIGEGLTRRLSQIAFTLNPPAIHLKHSASEYPRGWALRLLHLPVAHLLAVAAEKKPHEAVGFSIEAIEMAALL